MNRKITIIPIFFLALISVILFSCDTKQKPVKVELLSRSWLFEAKNPAIATLTAQDANGELTVPADTTKGFTIKFTAVLKEFEGEKTIIEIPEILTVRLRQHDANDRARQNYPAYKMKNGSVPVLEASIALRLPTDKNPVENMVIGIPLAMLEKPYGEHEVTLNFSGVEWTMYIDGELLDNDFALGYPQWQGKGEWKSHAAYIKKADFYYPDIKPERIKKDMPETMTNIQYWTPPGHNTWVGDVATFYHKGRYHVFYLFDRREHGSKFGRGGHYFEHLSTADFKTWSEHEAAMPIEEQWETLGTGTPFVFDEKFCISYGLHTTRIYPREVTTLPAQWNYLNEHGKTGTFTRDNTTGFPAGSTYSVSEDGISNFKKTGIMFHPCENPSVYTTPDGKLRMLANYGSKGTWESESIDGGWHTIDADFPYGGDCTFYFRWGRFDYILGGFNRMWSKPSVSPDNSYADIVRQGIDFYNGFSVPAVTEIEGERFLLAGWVSMKGWGGTLAVHELVQYPDGRIGTKWMEEIVPATEKEKRLATSLSEKATFSADNDNFLLTFDVHPITNKKGKLGVVLLPDTGDKDACEMQIRLDDMYAQYGGGSLNDYAGKEKSLREGGNPQGARNYAIENLIDTNKPFTMRMIIKGTDKFGGSVVDTEIAGRHTMISYRPGLRVKNLLFRTEDVELRNISIAQLSE
ncbi:MAG: hypothetical protein LBV43_10100 [Prevotella sp.]|jgi:hypothetical protein|nr:hypothetical protein [Prevotella sp.]